MTSKQVKKLLIEVRAGRLSVDSAIDALKGGGGEMIGGVHLDHHRRLRTEVPEVIYGENKTAEQIIDISRCMLLQGGVVMATRVDSRKGAIVCQALPELVYHASARMIVGNNNTAGEGKGRGLIAVLAAGTSDVPVAEEACLTVACLGHRVERAYDVGVAGIHRLFACEKLLDEAAVFVVVAGMEGALPTVVAGLVDQPVIAVPTSVGYGTGLGGVAALMGMLNGCAPGVAVVNIDNGFGAGCMAVAINRNEGSCD